MKLLIINIILLAIGIISYLKAQNITIFLIEKYYSIKGFTFREYFIIFCLIPFLYGITTACILYLAFIDIQFLKLNF